MTEHRFLEVTGLALTAAVVAALVGGCTVTRDADHSRQLIGPSAPTATSTATESDANGDTEPIRTGPSQELAVRAGAHGLRVAGDRVPGRWELTEARRDVWVAIRTDRNSGATSQWWGKGATTHRVPPTIGDILRGGVVISQDARWVVWTRPAADAGSKNPPRVMEVVDTTTGEVRWSRDAGRDAPEMGALAVTDDGVVVFGHCSAPELDRGGWPQCGDARVDVWAPAADVVATVPAEVSVGDSPFADTVASLTPLVRRTGAHNGLLVRRTKRARPLYLRLSDRGDVEPVAILPKGTLAVTVPRTSTSSSTTTCCS